MIQTGTAWYSVQTPGWNLHVGTGPRSFRTPDISFQPQFPAPPTVVLAIGGVDSEHVTNLRATLQAYDIEPEEFSIEIGTWGDSAIYQLWVTWIAHD